LKQFNRILFVFHIEEEESITYYEELENEMKDYSHGTVDSITLEKDALKVTELAENPFGILGLNKPVIEPKAEEVIENKEEEKDFLQVMHSTF
jgi:soluble cytochrome b562